MKIVVLIGSPRKKDSYNVCKLIEQKLEKQYAVEFEYIFLKDYVIEDCKGCDLCFQKSEKLCPCKDDLYIIKEKLLKADGIIISSPVYAYQVTATLKRLIDRLSYLFHRQELVGKPTLIVVTTGGSGQKQVSKYLKMTVCGWGCNLIGSINVVSPFFFKNEKENLAWGYDERYNKTITEKIEKLSEELIKYKEKISPPTPSFYDIFMFNCLRSKTFTSRADHDFWKEKGWLDSNYFYDVPINIFKKVFGSILKLVIDSIGKKFKNESISS